MLADCIKCMAESVCACVRRTAGMQMQHTVANHVEHCMDSIMQNAVAAASAAE